MAEGFHRVDLHGAARGDVAGGQGDGGEQRRHGDESERVAGADAEEHRFH